MSVTSRETRRMRRDLGGHSCLARAIHARKQNAFELREIERCGFHARVESRGKRQRHVG